MQSLSPMGPQQLDQHSNQHLVMVGWGFLGFSRAQRQNDLTAVGATSARKWLPDDEDLSSLNF